LAAPPGQSRLIEATLTTLLGRTDVDWLRGTRLVNVTYEASDPRRAAAIADGLVQSFIRSVREARQGASTEATTWLAGAIESQRAKVAAAERALQTQRDQEQLIEGIVSVDDRRTLVEQRLKELATARNVARTRRLEREALFREMKGTANPLELPDVLRNPVITQMRVEQGNLERRLAMLDEKYMDQHPEVVRVRNQLEETRRKIDEEAGKVVRAAENDAAAALAQELNLGQALDEAKAEYESLSRRTVSYDAARRDLDAAKAVLASLTGRMKETDVAQGLRAVYVRMSEPAAPPRQAAGPRRLLKFLCCLVAGLVGGVGLALLKDSLDDTVRTPDDVRTSLDLPLLSVVPVAAGAGGALLLGRPGSADLVEPARLLRAHVEQAVNGSGRGHVILLTSTVPGEGKTLTSANLALSLARGGQRVVLVDADLRQAEASRLLGCAPGPGLAEALAAGRGALARVRPADGLSLDVLPAGGTGSEDRCAARTIEPLLSELRSAYDWVVVDA
ncbi:MAG TPA: exopolysaccharide transport family protein, partial [Planctomycetota bacterium]|nr:exopolysaccharide transport family protein [Planctomycetota bacterium]